MSSRFFHNLPLMTLSGIGPTLAKKFHDLGILTVADLLLHFPLRYEDRASTHAINEVTVGNIPRLPGRLSKTKSSRQGSVECWCAISKMRLALPCLSL